jgi:surface antigen
MKYRLPGLAAVCAICLAAPILASNVGFMKDAPYAAYFTDEDRRIFHSVLNKALDEAKESETRSWTNPDTGAQGEITALARLAPPDENCRRANVTNRARGRTGKGEHVFCRTSDGNWLLAPGKGESQAGKAKAR